MLQTVMLAIADINVLNNSSNLILLLLLLAHLSRCWICRSSLLAGEQKSAVFPASCVGQKAIVTTRRCSEDGETDHQHEK